MNSSTHTCFIVLTTPSSLLRHAKVIGSWGWEGGEVLLGCLLSSASGRQEYSDHVPTVLVRVPLKQTLGGGCVESDVLGKFLGKVDTGRERGQTR